MSLIPNWRKRIALRRAINFKARSIFRLVNLFPKSPPSVSKKNKSILKLSQADELTRKSEDEYRLFFENMGLSTAINQIAEMVVVTDINGTIWYVNPAFEVITGYSRNEAVGQNPRILKSGKQNEEFYKFLWITLLSGKTWHGNFVNMRKDGLLYTMEARISPVNDESGDPVGFVAVERDITHELIMQDQYRQSQKMEAVGRLVGGVAHDLNNMLTPILGYVEILLLHPMLDESMKNMLNAVHQASRSARNFVQKLLAFSRKQALDVRPINLNKVIVDFEKLLRRTIHEDIKIELDLASSIPMIMADVVQLEQVIMNLAINAQDAMPKGGRLLFKTSVVELDEEYETEHREVIPGEYLLLAVTDAGHGITQEARSKIFEPFFSTKAKGEGTGLGLTNVLEIVMQHGGHIDVHSELGKGSTFNVFFPASAFEFKSVADVVHSSRLICGQETVLIVEDDDAVRSLIANVLKQHGYVVFPVNGVDEGTQFLIRYEGALNLLLTDVVMTDGNGKDLLALVEQRFPMVKVIFMSGYADNVIADHGVFEEGINFIKKPFSIQDLTAKVREVLDG